MSTRVLLVQGAAERAGAERVLLALLRNLDRSRVEPIVAFLSEGPFVDEVRAAGVEVVQLDEVSRLRQAHRVPAAVRQVAALVAERRPAIVQATGEKMSVITGWAARRSRTPAVFWLHDSPSGGHVPTWLTQLAMAATPRASVVTCSRWLADAFRRRLRMRAVAIQNGLDLERLPARPDREGVIGPPGWPEDSVVVGHFTRLERWKGTDVFLKACARLSTDRPDARFLVVGGALFGRDTEYAAGLPDLAARLGLGERVHFAGFRSDALDLMAASDVVVHSSLRADPFPTVVLEAMALGRALVATTTRGPEEAVVDGRTGVLVPPADEGALAAAVSDLAGSPETRRRLGDAARAHVLANFDARRMAADFEAHWDALAAGAAGRARG